ncbi:toll/interleukin-1 receptor domain-containing protein [uncultured Thomasclavelia sp.]|uniref:toll/interleukin-1 receptor domain-containing protein n=1 Tax=uncultured Thomasclavelia sp. TaxID=3025759 RepID=UPI00280AAEEC|nr:toll/interleukin-1 receptor domain-containing protein [uncultured Thomasclavelia sp.]
MSGVTKHIFEHEIRDIISMWNTQLKTLKKILPIEYTEKDVISLLKRFYPHEWNSVEAKYIYYKRKDKFLKKRLGTTRYNMVCPEKLLQDVPFYKKIISLEYRQKYSENFSKSDTKNAEEALWRKREPKICRIDDKIETAKSKTQQVTPEYLEQLIGFYERKATSQKDKMYILLELKKYYNNKVIQFFFKLNDTELNKQLRWIAFYHLQSFNYQPRARRQKYMQVHAKNKKRREYLKYIYPNERYTIPKNPQELKYRIENGKEQKIKSYDFFISHSSKDSSAVQKLINYENQQGKNVFCDWINDVDYLKRHLLCDATLQVLEKRLEESRAVIFVESENSMSSIWCKYELNYCSELGRPIYVICKSDIENSMFELKLIENKWFKDENYKRLALLKGLDIESDS